MVVNDILNVGEWRATVTAEIHVVEEETVVQDRLEVGGFETTRWIGSKAVEIFIRERVWEGEGVRKREDWLRYGEGG